jgi:hypothetical protein
MRITARTTLALARCATSLSGWRWTECSEPREPTSAFRVRRTWIVAKHVTSLTSRGGGGKHEAGRL